MRTRAFVAATLAVGAGAIGAGEASAASPNFDACARHALNVNSGLIENEVTPSKVGPFLADIALTTSVNGIVPANSKDGGEGCVGRVHVREALALAVGSHTHNIPSSIVSTELWFTNQDSLASDGPLTSTVKGRISYSSDCRRARTAGQKTVDIMVRETRSYTEGTSTVRTSSSYMAGRLSCRATRPPKTHSQPSGTAEGGIIE